MTAQRLLSLAGIAGGVYWLLLIAVFSPDWGPPGSARYLDYEAFNRAWPPGLLLMLAGWIGLQRRFGLSRAGLWLNGLGFGLMVAGNVAEFWLFSDQPYAAGFNGRNLAWSAFLLGWLLHLIGALVWGSAGRLPPKPPANGGLPAWAAALLILLLPASFVLFVAQWANPASALAVALLSALALLPERPRAPQVVP
jgi:hypothetical protein